MPTVTLTTGAGSTQQWSPPTDCFVIDLLELWGPGGSGAKETGARCTGGGAGAYVPVTGPIVVATLLTAGTVPYFLGAGGAAVTVANTVGNAGAAKTWFIANTGSSTYWADIGLGGQTAASGTAAGGVGGILANGQPPTGTGQPGGAGGTSTVTTGASGGGASGSSAGAGVNAVAVTTAVGGAGATAPAGGGSGGAASITTSNATAGSQPGGGGGAVLGATGNSGAGGAGQIKITYTSNKLLSGQQFTAAKSDVKQTVSNGGQTLTRNATGDSNGMSFAIPLVTTGTWYFEINVSSASDSFGIANFNESYWSPIWPGGSPLSLGWSAATVFNNSASIATIATLVAGIVGCAFDLIDHLIYFRNTNGLWNNSGTANPVTNTGGIAIPSTVYTGGVYPVAKLQTLADTGNVGFAASSWVYPAPVGFLSLSTGSLAWMTRPPIQIWDH